MKASIAQVREIKQHEDMVARLQRIEDKLDVVIALYGKVSKSVNVTATSGSKPKVEVVTPK